MGFALAVSLLASVLTREDTSAGVVAGILGVLLCALGPAIHLAQGYFSPGAQHSLWWLRLSPAYGPFLVWGSLRSGFGPATSSGACLRLCAGTFSDWLGWCSG